MMHINIQVFLCASKHISSDTLDGQSCGATKEHKVSGAAKEAAKLALGTSDEAADERAIIDRVANSV